MAPGRQLRAPERSGCELGALGAPGRQLGAPGPPGCWLDAPLVVS